MSNSMTDYTGPRDTPPSPHRRSRWVDALAIGFALVALVGIAIVIYADHHNPPPPPAVTMVPVTRIVTVETTREIDHYWTVAPVVQTVEVTRIVNTNTFYTPTPPQSGRG